MKDIRYRKGQLGYVEGRQAGDRRMARVRYWEDVSGQHARRRVSTEWRDVTDLSESEIQLWRMKTIAGAGVHDPRKPIPSETTFKTHAEQWLKDNLPRYKKSVRETMESHLTRYLIPAFGDLGPEGINGALVNKWLGTVRLQDGAIPSRLTLKHIVSTLQVVLSKPFPKREIRYPADARPAKRIYCPTDEEVTKLIAASRGVYRLLFAMAATTGMRSGELYGLHIEDIDFDHNCIIVRQAFCRGELQSTKTDRSRRVVAIPPHLAKTIRSWAGERTFGFLLTSSDGTPLHHSNVLHRELHPTLKRLGLPRFGMHSFRHYSVSYCVRNGMSFDDVRLRHGHGSEDIMRMYLHLAPGHDNRLLKLIPNIAVPDGPIVGPKKVAANVVEFRRAV